MASFGQASGCFFLAVWNLFSFGVEYVLLRVVYYSCPALAVKVQFEPCTIYGKYYDKSFFQIIFNFTTILKALKVWIKKASNWNS